MARADTHTHTHAHAHTHTRVHTHTHTHALRVLNRWVVSVVVDGGTSVYVFVSPRAGDCLSHTHTHTHTHTPSVRCRNPQTLITAPQG